MKEKIGQCITESRMLCKIVWYKPQAVYSFSITGFKRKPTYIMQTIPNINTQLEQLEEIVRTEFIPAISGGINSSDIEWKVLFFPPKLWGLGISIFSEIANRVQVFENDLEI